MYDLLKAFYRAKQLQDIESDMKKDGNVLGDGKREFLGTGVESEETDMRIKAIERALFGS